MSDNSNSKKNDTAYAVFSSVDSRVAKPVLGSDGAAAWQHFQSNNKSNNNRTGTTKKTVSVAPTAPLKAVDRAAGFTSWHDERQNEERVRQQAGEAAVNAGYTQFQAKNDTDDSSKLTKKERQRIEKRLLAEDQEYFFPSKKWQGPKWDYVFTTKPHHGTGYFFDGMDSLKKLRGEITDEQEASAAAQKLSSEEQNNNTTTDLADDETEKPKKKRKKSKKAAAAAAVTIVNDPTNPLQQVAEALQKKRQQQQQQQQQQWQTAVDPSTGKTYYYNPLSGERSWDKPLPAGWQVATDATTGKEYYYNPDTGITAWERPS